jgi:uncharacterized protein
MSEGRSSLPGMSDYFLVTQTRGPAYDSARPRREQAGWDEHAAFMNALVADGSIALGGPVGDVNEDDVLLVMDVPSEACARDRLAGDPWVGTVLAIKQIQPWSVWLRGPHWAAPTGRRRQRPAEAGGT